MRYPLRAVSRVGCPYVDPTATMTTDPFRNQRVSVISETTRAGPGDSRPDGRAGRHAVPDLPGRSGSYGPSRNEVAACRRASPNVPVLSDGAGGGSSPSIRTALRRSVATIPVRRRSSTAA